MIYESFCNNFYSLFSYKIIEKIQIFLQNWQILKNKTTNQNKFFLIFNVNNLILLLLLNKTTNFEIYLVKKYLSEFHHK